MVLHNFVITILSLISLVNAAELKMDDRFILHSQVRNATFNHWKAAGSAIFLQDKTVIAPELSNQIGMIYAKNTFNLVNFEYQMDLSSHNKMLSSFGKGKFMIYLLRDNPMKSAHEFAYGLENLFDGFQIEIIENSQRNQHAIKDKHAPPKAHEVKGTLRDEEFNVVSSGKCLIAFENAGIDATIYLRVHKNKISVSFTDPKTKKESKGVCMQVPLPEDYFTEDHDVYTFVAAQAGYDPQMHVVHEIRFYDTDHLHDDEEVNTKADLKPFTGKHIDQLRKGRVQDQYTTESYNKQLIRHNQIYSRVVSEFIANSETIVKGLHTLPHHSVMKNMTAQFETINNRFTKMSEQFSNYDRDVSKYMLYLFNHTQTRQDKREEAQLENNPFAQEQKDLIDKLNGLQPSITKYTNAIQSNHLIEQIKKYDEKFAAIDNDITGQDNALISTLMTKNARDESMSDEEAQHLMNQQVRKIMSQQVKLREKQIKSQVKAGQLGMTSKTVDYIMYCSIVFVLAFGYVAFNKLQEQKDALVI